MQVSTHNRSVLRMLTEIANAPPTALSAPADVRELARRYAFSAPLHADSADVTALRELQARMRGVLAADPDRESSAASHPSAWPAVQETAAEAAPGSREERTAAFVNELYREGAAHPQLLRHGGWGWHLHTVANEAGLAARMAADVAIALTDLLVDGELSRIGTCSAEDCAALFADFSRNRSKRFCDEGNCANRTHVAAHRARRAHSTEV